jgi:hypothetical protein
VQVKTWNASGTLVDIDFNFNCYGPR